MSVSAEAQDTWYVATRAIGTATVMWSAGDHGMIANGHRRGGATTTVAIMATVGEQALATLSAGDQVGEQAHAAAFERLAIFANVARLQPVAACMEVQDRPAAIMRTE